MWGSFPLRCTGSEVEVLVVGLGVMHIAFAFPLQLLQASSIDALINTFSSQQTGDPENARRPAR